MSSLYTRSVNHALKSSGKKLVCRMESRASAIEGGGVVDILEETMEADIADEGRIGAAIALPTFA